MSENTKSEFLPQRPQMDFRIDIVRGICILAVVSTHFGGSFVRQDLAWKSPFYLGLILNQVSSFAVPAFIFLSGWMMSRSYGARPIDYAKFYRRRIVKLGIPYLIVTLLYFILFPRADFITNITAANIIPKILYYGVQPTLYFIPLIFQLYLLYPFIRLADAGSNAILGRKSKNPTYPVVPSLVLLSLFLIVHLTIGHLAYTGKISYHTFCLRFSPFWIFYFYAGMHFKSLMQNVVAEQKINMLVAISLVVAAALFAWNIARLLDTSRVGQTFERNMLDFAYCRPEILPYDIVSVFAVGMLLLRPWSFRSPVLESFGQSSYYIYILHIIVLLYIAWQVPAVIATCTKYPEVMLFVIFICCSLIAAGVRYLRLEYLIKALVFVDELLQDLIVRLKSFQPVK